MIEILNIGDYVYTIPTKNTFYKKGIGSIAEIIEVFSVDKKINVPTFIRPNGYETIKIISYRLDDGIIYESDEVRYNEELTKQLTRDKKLTYIIKK